MTRILAKGLLRAIQNIDEVWKELEDERNVLHKLDIITIAGDLRRTLLKAGYTFKPNGKFERTK